MLFSKSLSIANYDFEIPLFLTDNGKPLDNADVNKTTQTFIKTKNVDSIVFFGIIQVTFPSFNR